MSGDVNCHEVTDDYELVTVQCNGCGFHLGLDATFLEQVGTIVTTCPSCGLVLSVAESEA